MVSDLERQRLENIQRNQKALREFQLKEAANRAFGDKENKEKRAASGPKLGVSTESKRRKQRSETPPLPRRVRNLRKHGIKDEDREKYLAPPPEPAPVVSQAQTRKEGELEVRDLVGQGNWDQALQVMQGLGGKVSHGDLFAQDLRISNKQLGIVRDELSSGLTADPRDIKVVSERVTSIVMHPSPNKRVVIAGDKLGGLGLWDADRPDDEGLVNFNYHTRGVATIVVDPDNMSRVYTGSYDGSIRILDLVKQSNTEAFVYNWNLDAGISDFALVDPNTLYYSTLDGHFGVHDSRVKGREPMLLCEKKIGGFSVNPKNKNHVATASLDRTLKIWDLRKPYQLDGDEGEPEKGAFLSGIYSSRLSVSASSWNTSEQIVCNGYDNTINVFDMANLDYGESGNAELVPSVRLQHNCQTGRWVSILKARWQERPRDGIQKFVIGNMNRFADVFAGSGDQLAHLDAEHLTAVPAVAQFHRSENWIAGGVASGKVYLWTPRDASQEEEVAEADGDGGVHDDSGGHDDGDDVKGVKKEQ